MKAFENLRIKHQTRNYAKLTNLKLFEGFDTETAEGKCRILADSHKYIVVEDLDDCLEFLTAEKNLNTYNFLYNLNYDFQAIFKHDLSVLEQFFDLQAEYENYEFFYIPDKFLKIKKKKRMWYFYDIAQFYDRMTLSDASKDFLNLESSDLKGDRSVLFLKYSNREIGKYCVEDALHTKLLSEYLLKPFCENFTIPKRFFSAGYLASEYLLRNFKIPTINEISKNIIRDYYHAFRGGWFDTYEKGNFDNAYQYDIISAYPYEIKNLPNVENGEWVGYLDEKANLGVVECLVKSNSKSPNYFSPLSIKIGGINLYPYFVDAHKIFLTLNEFKVYKEIFDITVMRSSCFFPSDENDKPFEKPIERLFELKKASIKDSPVYRMAKITMNAIYGKTIQTKGASCGNLFNPIYASEITANTRIRLFKAVENPKDVVSVLTDAVITKNPIKKEYIKNELGFFDDGKCGNFKIITTGVYICNGEKLRSRGFARKDFFKLVEGNGSLVFNKPLKFRSGFIRKKAELINTFIESKYNLKIQNDVKRNWNFPDSIILKDLLTNAYDSEPKILLGGNLI